MTTHFKTPVHPVIENRKDPIEQAKDWAKSHQEILAVSVLVLLLLVFGVPYYLKSQRQTEKDASNMLSMAEYYLNSQVDPKNGPFKTNQEKYQQSLETFQRILNNYSGTPSARIAQFYVGKCQYLMGQYPQAYASFDAAMGELKKTPLADAAALGKAHCMAAQEKYPEAMALFENFMAAYPDSHLLPEAKLAYSDALLKAGNPGKAKEVLQALSRDSKTAEGKEAARRLQALP